MNAPRYVEESDDLIAARAKDAAAYKEFLRSVPKKPACPECGSEKLGLVTAGNVWLECLSCDSGFSPNRDRLIEACLLSHKDREGK